MFLFRVNWFNLKKADSFIQSWIRPGPLLAPPDQSEFDFITKSLEE